MRKYFLLIGVVSMLYACSKSDNNSQPSQTIITSDSSEYSGRLKVVVLDGANNNNVINGASVFLYPTYEDLKRNFYLNTVVSAGGNADFGYVLQGNYYLRAQSGTKSDTNVVQVMGQKTITRTMIVR
ncbi:MAG: hypothetical protein V4538_09625 [Bacteroidota bacterium]